MIDLTQAMKDRRSVRSYISRPIDDDKVTALQNEIQKINAESGLHFQLMINEPRAFSGMPAPTAVNQQKVRFTPVDTNTVKAGTAFGPYTKLDLGIGKLHFETGAGKENFQLA